MRRDNVTLEVADVAWLAEDDAPRRPALVIHVEDDVAAVRDRLFDVGDPLDAGAVDVTFRYQGSPAELDDPGVLAVTNRMTGEYLLEVNAAAEEVQEFVSAASRYGERSGDATRYRVRVVAGDDTLADLEKRTLLVYAEDGELLRGDSLIPSGVEI